jgi:transposase
MAGTRKRWPRDAAKERFWRTTVERWQRAGISIRAFCRRESLSEPSFYAWRRELRRRDEEKISVKARPGFMPVQCRPAFVPVRVAAQAPFLEIVLAAGRVLRVPPGFDRQTLREVVAALEAPSC